MADPSSVRVVRIVTRLNVGGPSRQIASLMRRLDPARFAQILVSGPVAPAEGPGVIDVPGERIEIADLRRPVSPGADRRALARLTELLGRIRPAIVHTHQAKAGWLGRMAAARAGVAAIVHTYHGHTFRGYFPWPASALFLSLERMAARRSTALVAQAPAQAEDIAAFLGPSARAKTRVILPGIELPDRVPARRRAPADRVRVLFPSRLERVKDPALALDVMRLLGAGYELRVFGDGALRHEIEAALARDEDLRSRVWLHPPTADRAVMFAGVDVTLLTSREEGTPLALIESQAFGVPVVAADVGAVRSVVADGGGLVVPRTAAALAEGVARASGSPVSAGAIGWVRERFSAERMAAEVAALYEDLLRRAGSGTGSASASL